MGATNYGSLLTWNGSAIADCMIVDYPEVSVSNIDGTSHQSGGVEVRFPGGLRRASEFTCELVVASGVMSTINTNLVNKTVGNVILTAGAVVQYAFSGFMTSYKPNPSDVGSEDIVKATVTIQATGGMTITNL
jgi:hypothetical protein